MEAKFFLAEQDWFFIDPSWLSHGSTSRVSVSRWVEKSGFESVSTGSSKSRTRSMEAWLDVGRLGQARKENHATNLTDGTCNIGENVRRPFDDVGPGPWSG